MLEYSYNLSRVDTHLIVIDPHMAAQNHLLSQAQLHQGK
jgi:hypothetical protein